MTPRLGLGITGFVLVTALAGCGQSGASVTDPGSGAAGGGQASPSAPAATSTVHPSTGKTDLLITTDDGAGATTRWTLSCNPPGGDHPDAAKACATLVSAGNQLLAPVPKGLVCTEIYGGPEKATVTGTYAGAPVKASYTRANGCEISRWNAMKFVLPKVATGPK